MNFAEQMICIKGDVCAFCSEKYQPRLMKLWISRKFSKLIRITWLNLSNQFIFMNGLNFRLPVQKYSEDNPLPDSFDICKEGRKVIKAEKFVSPNKPRRGLPCENRPFPSQVRQGPPQRPKQRCDSTQRVAPSGRISSEGNS